MTIEAPFIEEYRYLLDALIDKNAETVDFIDLRAVSGVADVFIIATARSEINAQTLQDAAEDALDAQGQIYKVEGRDSKRWRLVDAGHIVVHIFSREAKEFYSLDKLWGDAPSIRFGEEEM